MDGVLDFPHEDQLVLIEASIGSPVKIAHGVEFSSFGLGSPSCHERAMNSPLVHESGKYLGQFKEIIFDKIEHGWVGDPESFF